MAITTLSSREFNQDTGGAKRAARLGPVFITDRGEPAHVLLSIQDYRRIVGEVGIVEQLGLPEGVEDIEIEFPRSRELSRPIDLS